MAEMKDAHVVEIPVDEEHQQKLISAIDTFSVIQHHPLMEISQSPGHLLLLKLWQREEDLFGRRIVMKETRLDVIRRELFQLCCFFFIFHTLFLTILFTSYSDDDDDDDDHHQVCRQWWIPSLLSLSTSVVVVFLVQTKLFRFWKVSNQLQRERNDNRTLTRCIQELRMKGSSFDLSKDPQNGGKRMKSSSVEFKWKPLTWLSQYLITICLFLFYWYNLPRLQIHALCLNLCLSRVHLEKNEFEGRRFRARKPWKFCICITFVSQDISRLIIVLHLLPIPSLKGMKRLGPKVTRDKGNSC